MPLLGLICEGARTNLCLQSQTFDNASWTNTNVTVTANAVAAPDGTTTADLLYPASSGTDADRRTLQAVTSTATAHTVSFYLKYAGFRWIMVSNTDAGAANDKNWFDVQNGVVGTIGAGTTSMSAVSVGNGWYRVSVTATNASTNCYAWISCVDGDGSSTVTASGTNGVYAWGAQVELGSFASSYIATTTVAVTRNADVLTYSSAGNIDGTKGWCYAEVITNAGANHAFVGFDATNQLMSQSNQKVSMYDATNQAVSTSVITLGVQFKGAVTWGSSGVKATINGEAPGSNASFDGDAVDGKANIYIGEWAGGSGSNFGTIRNVRIGQRQLSSSELAAVTQ